MIEKLDETYDEEMSSCISRRGRSSGWVSSGGFILSKPLIALAKKFVCNCCDILNEKKNTRITAEFKGDAFDPASFSVHVCFLIDWPENRNTADKDKIVSESDRLIRFEMPRFSSIFNNDPLVFYKDLMSKIYDKYKMKNS